MIRRFIVATAAAAVLASAGSAVAQERATVVLKSGERITGELTDHAAIGFTVYVNGERRVVRENQVARIEFSGDATVPQEALGQFAGGKHIAVLKSGNTVIGRLYDVSGRTPLRITFDTPTGPRRLQSDEIAAIHFVAPTAGPSGATATSDTATEVPGGPGLLVPGNERWVDTGITVRQGQRLAFSAQGEIVWAPNEKSGPAGSLTGKRTPNAPLPNELAGALIARIGPVETFAVGGPTSQVSAPASGRLFLG